MVREGREQIIELVAGLMRAGSRNPRTERENEMMAVALVGAGEAVANRLSTGDVDVEEAAQLMIDLFWYGLKGSPAERAAAHPEAGGSDAAGD
jgi:hypothetical protein